MPWINKQLIVECLRELSDRDAQRRLWLSDASSDVSSFTEAVEQLFTDSGLTPDLEKRSTRLGHAVESALLDLQSAVRAVDEHLGPATLIETTEMEKVRRLAAVALKLFEPA